MPPGVGAAGGPPASGRGAVKMASTGGGLCQMPKTRNDTARVLGHDIPGGTYSNGPGLKRLRDVVEQI